MNWYLPTQKELLQAYLDGMNNKTGATLSDAAAFTTSEQFWSSSEDASLPGSAWVVNLNNGFTDYISKSVLGKVRCVAREPFIYFKSKIWGINFA